MITKEKILKCKHNIFMRFDKSSTYRELCEESARGIVSDALDGLINELESDSLIDELESENDFGPDVNVSKLKHDFVKEE